MNDFYINVYVPIVQLFNFILFTHIKKDHRIERNYKFSPGGLSLKFNLVLYFFLLIKKCYDFFQLL